MGEKKKIYEAGKQINSRFPKDFLQYVLDFINSRDVPIYEYIEKGALVEMEKEDLGVFLLADGLDPEKREKLRRSPELQRAAIKIIDFFLFSDKSVLAINKQLESEGSAAEEKEEAATVEAIEQIDVENLEIDASALDLEGFDLGI